MQESSLPASDLEAPDEGWFAPLAASWPRTLACVATMVGIGLAASFLLPANYVARGKIILPNTSNRASALAGVSSALGLGLGSDSGSLPMFTAILKSEQMLILLSKQTGYTRKALRKMFSVRDDAKANTIEVAAMGKDRGKVLKIVQRSLIDLDTIKSRVNLPLKEDQATRLRTNLTERERGLTQAENALEAFLRTAKTLPGGGVSLYAAASPDKEGGDLGSVQSALGYKQQLTSLEIELQKLDSSVSAIQSASKAQETAAPLDLPPVKLWSERIAAAQAKLAELRPKYRSDAPEVVDAENALTGIQRQMQVEVDRYLSSVRANIAGPGETLSVTRAGVLSQIAEIKKYVDAAPEESIQYLRLFRDLTSNEAIVNQLRLMYEKAMIDRSDDPNRWSVLDAPEIDQEYDSRNITRNSFLGALGGIAVAYGLGSRRFARSKERRVA